VVALTRRALVEFRVLGPLEVRGDDGPLALGGAKQRALLALLVLNAGRVVPRERIVDALWGEAPPESAVKGIQLYVWQLRKLLPEGTVVTRSSGYVLEVEPESVDLGRFERLVAEAHRAEPEEAARLLGEATALWRGPALAGLGDGPALRAEADRVDELRLAALEERFEAELALGRHGEVVAELELLVIDQPHRERVREQLMLALYRSGRQAEALEAYRDVRAALDELGLEPGDELRELERRILTHDRSLELGRAWSLFADEAPLPGPLVPEPAYPFVGRAGELAALRAALERAEGGEGGLALIAAEAGGGKTRLIRELAHEALGRGAVVLYGVSDASVTTPYQPVREWLEFLIRAADPNALREYFGSGASELARLVPELSALTGVPAPERRDADNERFALQAAVIELLARLSRSRPLLVVADDVHWADGETLHLLRRLARAAPEARWVLIVAYRTQESGAALAGTVADLGRQDGATELTLGDLSERDVAEFVRSSSESEASAELVSALGELTNGTPLLLCELWRELLEHGGLEVTDTVHLARPSAELRGPRRVGELVRQRLARVAPQTAAVVEVAAVAGARFELGVVADAAGLDDAAFVAAVEEATDFGIVEQLPDPVPACRFTHELVRRAVYDRIKQIRRPTLHLRVGEALERVHGADPERVLPELAHHFTLAAPAAGAGRAVEYNLRAAEAALVAGALEDSAASRTRALDIGIEDPRRRASVQIELAWLLAELRQPERTRAMLDDVLATAAQLGDRSLAAHARVIEASQWWWLPGRPGQDEAGAIAEEAIAIFTEVGDELGLARARHLSARAVPGWPDLHRVGSERALVHANRAGDLATRSRVITSILQALLIGSTPVEDAIRRCQELLASSRGQPVLEAMIERALSRFHAMGGRGDEAREYDRRSNEVLGELDHHGAVMTGLWRADTMLLLGDERAAEDEWVEVWRSFGGGSGTIRAQGQHAASHLAFLCCDQGRWDDAEHWLAIGEAEPAARNDLIRPAAMARVMAHRGDLGDALALARRAIETADATQVWQSRPRVWLALAEVLRKSDRRVEADAAIKTAIGLYEQKGNVTAAARVRTLETRVTPAPAPMRRPSR
jgi:DNA-binding SARP family transcriptional activator